MPLFFVLDIDHCTRLAVWKIEEEEAFFSGKVPLQRTITHPHKRLQHLAGRYLLRLLFPLFPLELIKIADTRKPFLENEAFHFSISHCADFAAAIVSKEKRVGVDVEVVTPKIEKIKHRFSTAAEIALLESQFTSNNSLLVPKEQLTFLWSCKEAVFKWYGNGGVDFREDIVFEKIKHSPETEVVSELCFKKEVPIALTLHSKLFSDTVLSYLVT
jgi:phosphopantetheinyl transferase